MRDRGIYFVFDDGDRIGHTAILMKLGILAGNPASAGFGSVRHFSPRQMASDTIGLLEALWRCRQ